MNSEVTYGQEFPDYLRSNYVSTPLIDTKGDDFGLAPMTKGILCFVQMEELAWEEFYVNQKSICFYMI